MSVKSVKRFGSCEHLKLRLLHWLKYRLWRHNYVIVVTSQTFVTIVWNTSSLISVSNSMIIRAITQSYDGGPHAPPPPSWWFKKPISNRVKRLCSRQNFFLIQWGSFSNKYIYVHNLYHLYLSIYMLQNTGLDLYHMCCQPLFHEKNWKGPIPRHEKTNALCH